MQFSIKAFEQIDSTNTKALELIQKGQARTPTVIIADKQLAGRGHALNTWESEEGKNLTMSIIVRPHFIKPQEQFLLTQIISLSLIKLVSNFVKSHPIHIKWPNDIYIGDSKVAGILIQNTIKGALLDYSVLGIGLNINQEEFVSDAPNPVSLIHYCDNVLDIAALRTQLLNTFGYYYEAAQSASMRQRFNDMYMQGLYRYQELAGYKAGEEVFKASILGVDAYGQLILIDENRHHRQFGFKEVEFVI